MDYPWLIYLALAIAWVCMCWFFYVRGINQGAEDFIEDVFAFGTDDEIRHVSMFIRKAEKRYRDGK